VFWYHESPGFFAVRLQDEAVTGIAGSLERATVLDHEFKLGAASSTSGRRRSAGPETRRSSPCRWSGGFAEGSGLPIGPGLLTAGVAAAGVTGNARRL
jgi:hypothetical protein